MTRTRPVANIDQDLAFNSINDILRSSLLCGVDGGPQVKQLEAEFADYIGAPYAVGVSSGSSALLVSLAALDIGPGDEVILPAFTFIADLLAILHRGARPVFADIDPHTYNIDPADLRSKLTGRTRAVIVVHLFGRPADLAEIVPWAQRHGVSVIEDCCQAHGAAIQGERVGSIGDLSCFSFSQGHVLSGGTGGIVLTKDPALADAARQLRFFGVSDIQAITSDDDRDYDRLGFNFALNEFSAAMVRIQLGKLDDIIAERRAVADTYAAALASTAELELPAPIAPHHRASHHLFPVRVAKDAPFTRANLAKELRNRDVGFLTTYPRALH